MSAVSRRAARREAEVAVVLGTTRTKYRPRFTSAPDMAPVRLDSGYVLQAETKSTKRPPKLVTKALAQAAAYTPGAIPVAVIAPFGGEPIACLPLKALAELLGLQPTREGQLPLAPAPENRS